MRVSTPSGSAAASRRGMALVGALAVLGAVGTLTGLVVWKEAAARRLIERHEASVQADHLARGALEIAIARLLEARPKAHVGWRFTAEQLLPGGTAVVDVRPSKESPALFRISCNACYRPDGRVTFNRSVEAVVRLDEKSSRVVVERVSPDPAAAK